MSFPQYIRRPALAAACLTALLGTAALSTAAHAQEVGNLAYYDISDSEYRGSYIEWKNFLEYTHREPCQNYVQPPSGFYTLNCNVYRVEQPRPVMAQQETVTTTVQEETRLLPVVSTYTIYFDFDKSNIRESEQATISKLANELATYNPTQVTVAGFTDTSGPADYNQTLSQKRAQSVAQALTARGIANQVIDKEAYGESMPAVQTGDGVKNEENRRVVVDFRR